MGHALGTILLLVLAFFISPLAVLIERGCSAQFFINVLLYILGIVPGIIHAFWIILSDR